MISGKLFRALIFLSLLTSPALVRAQGKGVASKNLAGHSAHRVATAQTAPANAELGDFDAYVQRTMQDWKAPGAAIAIIKDGHVILNKTYGLRDVKNNLPVTDQTLFPIASITKSFTVATLATLVDEGKLDWDKPVREYLPDFRLYDDELTAHVTPRDLVTHRTGLPRHDATWYRADLTREQLYHDLRYLEPSRDLRTEFQYNNLMFMTAGYMAGKLTGGTWEDAVRARIFGPLGMTHSSFDFGKAIRTSDDVARPYDKDDKEVAHQIPALENDEALGPAGSIVSNLSDMTKYLEMYLNKGQAGGKQILTAANVRAMTTPQMIIHTAGLDPEVGFSNYGMGLFVTTYRGHKYVQHGGNLDGFSLLISFLPDDNIGCVILLNMSESDLREVLAYNIADRLLGSPQVDWNQRQLARYEAYKISSAEAREKQYVPRRLNTSFSHPIDEYTGDYSNPAYGTVHVARAANDHDLVITYHTMKSTAEHWHYDVWRTPHNPLDPLEETEIMFHTGWDGNITSLSSPLEPRVKDIVFRRVPERRMRERSFLEPLTGTYQIADSKMIVTLRPDNVLIVTTPTQRVLELEPMRGYTFAIKGESAQSIDFKLDASGRVTEFAYNQAGSSSVFKKTQ